MPGGAVFASPWMQDYRIWHLVRENRGHISRRPGMDPLVSALLRAGSARG